MVVARRGSFLVVLAPSVFPFSFAPLLLLYSLWWVVAVAMVLGFVGLLSAGSGGTGAAGFACLFLVVAPGCG